MIDKIQVYPTPTTMKQLQMFWGLLGYWWVFVAHLTQVVHPLYALAKKGTNWHWTPTLEQAFQGANHIVKHTQALHFWILPELVN